MEPTPPLAGTDRYEIRRPLGHGGFGSVYAAHDRTRGGEVALKVLNRTSPEGMLRFKQEFRALAGIAHRNLVVLHDLYADAEPWFYTMELVDGAPLLLGGRASVSSTNSVAHATFDFLSRITPAPAQPRTASPSEPVPRPAPPDLALLRALFRQLAEGIDALHRSDRIHRDLKPSNVLVTADGRVVILDFGLIAAIDEHDATRAGTPDYVAPEQIEGAARPASDWYSFGVMLFEALTGGLPFRGPPAESIAARRAYDGPDPRERIEGLPTDLADLTCDLLRRHADQRPSGAEILTRLGGAPRVVRGAAFVGRNRERTALQAAADADGTRIVLVHGASGMGKSALVQRFFADVRERNPRAILLVGRCHEREVVPFKALDGLIDTLTRYLLERPELEVHEFAPDGVRALVRLFPVLRQVPAVAAAAADEPETPDPREVRRRAAVALRQILSGLGERQPLYIHIDDVQWGDADSAGLIYELLRPPRPPRLLLVAGCRSEGTDADVPKTLVGLARMPPVKVSVVELAGLTEEEARGIARQILGDDEPRIQQAVREAGGHPLFLDGLARVGPTDAPSTLGSLIAAQIDDLLPGARRVVELLAVAGRPLSRAHLRLVAGIGPAFETSVGALEAGRLVRAHGVADRDLVEPWHDRIRETVLGMIGPDRVIGHHRGIAAALQNARDVDPEHLLVHLRGARDAAGAAVLAEEAADRAIDALAFDHAAHLYREAISLGAKAILVRPKLARALTDGGRVEEAGAEWLRVAEIVPPYLALPMRREAAAAWLNAGHLDQGMAQLGLVLAPLHLEVAATSVGAIASLLVSRARLAWRGPSYVETAESSVPRKLIERIDACWTVATSLSVMDTLRGADFQMRHLRLALDAGEPRRIGLGLCLQANYATIGGSDHRPEADEILVRTREIVRHRPDDAHLGATVQLTEGLVEYLCGRYADAVPLLARAEATLRDGCTGVAWEMNTARIFLSDSVRWSGELTRLERLLQRYGQEATEGGNVLLGTYVACARAATLSPAYDQSAAGRATLHAAIAAWRDDRFAFHHWWAWNAENEIDLYEDRPQAALARIDAMWGRYSRALLPRVATLRAISHHQRARVRLAVAASSGGWRRRALIWGVRHDLAALEVTRVATSPGFAAQIRAGLAHLAGDRERALGALDACERAYRTAEALVWAETAMRTRGIITGGAEGRALVDAADVALAVRGVVRPAQFAKMAFPDIT